MPTRAAPAKAQHAQDGRLTGCLDGGQQHRIVLGTNDAVLSGVRVEAGEREDGEQVDAWRQRGAVFHGFYSV